MFDEKLYFEIDEFLGRGGDDSSFQEEKERLEEALENGRNRLIHNIQEFQEANDDVLVHYGVGIDDNPPPPGRGSGRYPKGSGENPNQHEEWNLSKQIKELKAQGMSPKDIAVGLGFKSTTQLRAAVAIESERKKAYYKRIVPELKAQGLTNKQIMERTGLSDGSVRNYLDADRVLQAGKTRVVAESLKKELATKKYIDIGAGSNLEVSTGDDQGVTDTKFKTAVAMLEQEGYKTYYIKVEQLTNPGKFTTVKVLGTPDSEWSEVVKNPSLIQPITSYHKANGKTELGIQPIVSIDSNRVKIRYSTEVGPDGYTGIQRDGIIMLRRGVDDVSLGRSLYSQVRIGVDGTHYMKGMAVYADDYMFPPGCDVIYNSNKKPGTDKYDVFKKMKPGLDGNVNMANPFGATIKEQSSYIDPKTGEEKLRVINKVNDQGDYGEWAKTISAQMLSKQPPELVKRQLSLTVDDRVSEYKDIMAVENVTVRKQLLESFAEDCDAAASHLKAKAFPGQSTNVLIAMPSLGTDECYSPNYEHGEMLALVRYPHAGPQEIVVARNNTRNQEGIKTIGTNAPDAIGLHPSQYFKLSGADSDGDTVVTIPMSKTRINSLPAFERMRGFDPNDYEYDGPVMKAQTQQTEMGKVTNLIADMGIFHASADEMTDAIMHSQVVIDAIKHHLDWKQSEEDHHIADLKKKYQNGGGASTLITRAGSEKHVPQRKPGTYVDPETGEKTRGVNPHTGELVWEETGDTYTKKVTTKTKGDYTKEITRMETITKMDDTKDAMTLLSSQTNPHPNEVLYGRYANTLKAMANEARREAVNTPRLEYSPAAAKEYASEVESINTKLTTALKNAPRERQAQILGRVTYETQLDANPEIRGDKAAMKRLRGQAITQARDVVGAKKQRVELTEREIEAIQKGAISDTKLKQVLDNADMDIVRRAFTPQTTNGISASMEALAKSMAANGYTNADIANRLGISNSSVSKILNG